MKGAHCGGSDVPGSTSPAGRKTVYPAITLLARCLGSCFIRRRLPPQINDRGPVWPRKQNPAYRDLWSRTERPRKESVLFLFRRCLIRICGFLRPDALRCDSPDTGPITLRRLFRPPVFPALRSAAAVVAFFDALPRNGESARTHTAKQRLQMVDSGHDRLLGTFDGRAGRRW